MKHIYALSAVLLLTAALSGCGGMAVTQPTDKNMVPPAASSQASAPAEKEATLTYYKAADDGLHILPVQITVKAGDRTAKTAITEMIRTDRNSKYPLLPAGVSLKNVHIEDGTATVNFTKELNQLKGETSESLFVAMVVDTLTEFPNIKRVEIRVEGQPPKFQMKMKQFQRDETLIQMERK